MIINIFDYILLRFIILLNCKINCKVFIIVLKNL